MEHTEEEYAIIEKYYRYCKRNGYIFDQPSVVEIGRKYAYLYNCNGLITKYVLKNHRFV
jgi:hypothetical protein